MPQLHVRDRAAGRDRREVEADQRARVVAAGLGVHLQDRVVAEVVAGGALQHPAVAVGADRRGACRRGVTVHVRTAGVSSTLPDGVGRPHADLVRPDREARCTACGDEQPLNAPPSREHWNVEPASLDENANVALVLVVEPVGPGVDRRLRRRRVGLDRPLVRLAGESSVLPDASVAWTRNSCCAERQVRVRLRRAARAERAAVERALERRARLVEENANVALAVRGRPVGPESIVVCGASKSGSPNVSTSCGGLLPVSRLLNCCSASPFSAASRIRKPWLAPASYIARTCERDVPLAVAGAGGDASRPRRSSPAGCST